MKVEKALPDVPTLRNDRPYTIEVYDASTPKKIQVLRINFDKNEEKPGILKTPSEGIEMGKYVKSSNKVAPALDENSILKADQSSGLKYIQEENVQLDGDEIERQQWSNPVEFLLSCIAMSVGLGNVWRFPFTAYENGGGAFLIPYLLVLILIGRPLYFLELSMGQFSSKSSVKVWDMVPFFRGVGYGQAIATSSVVSYYTCLIALAVFYLVASMQSILPWTVCDPSIELDNTVCVGAGVNVTEVLLNGSYPEGTQVIGSAEHYFLHSVLKEKEDIFDGIGNLIGCPKKF